MAYCEYAAASLRLVDIVLDAAGLMRWGEKTGVGNRREAVYSRIDHRVTYRITVRPRKSGAKMAAV